MNLRFITIYRIDLCSSDAQWLVIDSVNASLNLKNKHGITVKTCVKNGHSQNDQIMVFKTDYRLMQVKNIAECSKGSILQYFRPSLNYLLSFRPLFCLFLSGPFTQVLL